MRYLSLEWIQALSAEVAASDTLAELSTTYTIGITQVVTDGPEGDVTYHLQITPDGTRFGAGPADPEDVRLEQDWSTAVAVATGRMNAQEAFINGKILLFGSQQSVIDAQPVFAALDTVFSSVRERTRYE
ncbi:MAG: hypothetical protein CSA55_05375 [Ilumatobacter coccineus]|uniref:SCP2 domain-containing protein n=1 Tax=Ilumatobacter coccineus TaxID=467094 RepID=A0A2G6K9C9_9ACTN|nr:MAG: hypothetical protein CSA55_05375 [Ilumatobacter coccineus]